RDTRSDETPLRIAGAMYQHGGRIIAPGRASGIAPPNTAACYVPRCAAAGERWLPSRNLMEEQRESAAGGFVHRHTVRRRCDARVAGCALRAGRGPETARVDAHAGPGRPNLLGR